MNAQRAIFGVIAIACSMNLAASAQSVDEWATETLLDESHIAADPNFHPTAAQGTNQSQQYYPNQIYQQPYQYQEQTSYLLSGQMAPLQGTAQANQYAAQQYAAQNTYQQQYAYQQHAYQQNPYQMYQQAQNTTPQPIVIIQQMPGATAAAPAATPASAAPATVAAAPGGATAQPAAAEAEKQPFWKGLLNGVTSSGTSLPGNFGKGMSVAGPLLDAVLQRL